MDGQPTTNRWSRRSFVARLAVLTSVGALAPLLEACGSPAPAAPTAATKAGEPTAVAKAPAQAAAPAATAVPPPPTSAPASGQPTPGGALRVAMRSEPNSIDPFKIITTQEISFRRHVFNGLTEETLAGEVKPALAESWEAPDAKTYTFKLRKGLKFHDGTDVTAETVKASIQRASDPATGTAAAVKGIADRVATMTTPDASTIKIELKAPNGPFLADLSEVPIVPANFDPTKPVGTGPFAFVEWVRNQRIRVKKNPAYFKPGLPYLDEVLLQSVPDEDQKLSLLRTGQIDFVEVVPLPRVADLEKDSQFSLFMLPDDEKPSSYIVRVNCSAPPLDNPKVRQALNYALDRTAMLDINFGFGGVKSNFVPARHWVFNPNARSYNQRDVAKSKQLLSEAGLANGFSLELTHHTVDSSYKSLAQIIQANLAEIGVKVNLIPLDLGVWVDKVFQKKDFQLAQSGNSVRSDPDAIFSDMYDQTRVNGGAIQWKNDEAQQLLGQGRSLLDREERKKVYGRLQEIIQEEVPILVLNGLPFPEAGTRSVQGYEPDLRNSVGFETTWLKK